MNFNQYDGVEDCTKITIIEGWPIQNATHIA